MKVWRIAGILLACLVLVTLTSCDVFGGEEPEVEERLVEVVRGDLTVAVSGSGSVSPAREARLAFGTGGRVAGVHVVEGEQVQSGDTLARLETDALELAVAQAQLALSQAQLALSQAEAAKEQAQLARDQAEVARDQAAYALSQLEENPFTPSEQLDIAESQLEVAESQLAVAESQVVLAGQSLAVAEQSLAVAEQSLTLAQKQLGEAALTAPFAGTVAGIYINEGDLVSLAVPAIHLIDPSSLELGVQVDEIDIAEVAPGQSAVIEMDAFAGVAMSGEVKSISLLPTQLAGLVVYDVKIAFSPPEDAVVRVGMSATADIVVAERHDILLVPERAIKQDASGNYLVEVSVNGVVEERVLTIGTSDGFLTEVLDGLVEGEMVVERITRSGSSFSGLFQ